jgi:acetyltransferase-like isoleucine patch superfamily enzyme
MKNVEIQKELFSPNKSKFQKYQEVIIGETGFLSLVKYEMVMLFSSWVPGALGLFLRSKLYPLLLGSVGKNVSFGMNVVLRHPKKIFIKDNVVIDDACVLDAKGNTNKGIFVENGVFIGRNTILSCKNGDIYIDQNANIGFNSEIFSASTVKVGKDILIAAYTYLIGGDHDFLDNEKRTSKGITLEDRVWLGAGVKVLDGTTIGRNSIVGAGSVVNHSVPPSSVAWGTPAMIIGNRSSRGTLSSNGASLI